MGRLTILISLIIVLAISLPLLIYSLVLSPGGINGNTASTTGLIELEKYSGWRGVENMITPLDEYVKTVAGTTVSFSDLLWPYADSQNPFQDSVNRGSA